MSTAELFALSPGLLAFLIFDSFTAFPVLMLASAQLSQVARNITTNEMANVHRYAYLRNKEGRFANPFDKGCSANCANFCLQPMARDAEVEWAMGPPLLEAELTALLSGGQMSKAMSQGGGGVSIEMGEMRGGGGGGR